MNKSSIIILVIAAVVFTALGFVVGQVIAAGDNPGSKDDPVVSQTYVDELVGVKVTDLQNQIDELAAMINNGGTVNPPADNDNDNDVPEPDNNDTSKTVTVTGDSVNIRASASTSADVVTTVSSGTVLVYVSQSSVDGYIWYQIKTSGGASGWIRSDLCSSPR